MILVNSKNKFDKNQIVSFLNHQRNHITDMIKTAEQTVREEIQVLTKESGDLMLKTLLAEIKRLVRLKKINPSIKEQEIEQLKETVLLSSDNINQAQLWLDAIRFIITN